MDNETRAIYLAEIASKYYDRKMTQQEIADEIGMTRSGVSRLLTEAQEKGIVEIIVRYPYRSSSDLEKALVSTFKIKSASVLLRENKSEEDMLAGIGVLAARYFINTLQPQDIVGVSWGIGLYHMLRALRPMSYPGVEIVQLVGGAGTQKPSQIGTLLAPNLAHILGCGCHYLLAPSIPESEVARNTFMKERSIRKTLDLAARSDIALVGIGSTKPEVNTPYKLGYINDAELKTIINAGAVGNICGWHYSQDGKILDIDINRRLVGIDIGELSKIPLVIGVSGGYEKAEGILGALKGQYIDVLITDELAARRILELSK